MYPLELINILWYNRVIATLTNKNIMPQCICGRFFTKQYYSNDYTPDQDLCSTCRTESNPKSYVNSFEWQGGDSQTGSILEED